MAGVGRRRPDAEVSAGRIAAGPVLFREIQGGEEFVTRAGVAPVTGAGEQHFGGEPKEAVGMGGSRAFEAGDKDFGSTPFSALLDVADGEVFVTRREALGGAVGGADAGDFFRGGSGGEHGGNVAAVVGGHQLLPAIEFDVEADRDLFQGGPRRGTIIAGIVVVVDVGGGEGIGPLQLDTEDFGAGMLLAEGREAGLDVRFQAGPGGSPWLCAFQEGLGMAGEKGANFQSFEIIHGNDPEPFGVASVRGAGQTTGYNPAALPRCSYAGSGAPAAMRRGLDH